MPTHVHHSVMQLVLQIRHEHAAAGHACKLCCGCRVNAGSSMCTECNEGLCTRTYICLMPGTWPSHLGIVLPYKAMRKLREALLDDGLSDALGQGLGVCDVVHGHEVRSKRQALCYKVVQEGTSVSFAGNAFTLLVQRPASSNLSIWAQNQVSCGDICCIAQVKLTLVHDIRLAHVVGKARSTGNPSHASRACDRLAAPLLGHRHDALCPAGSRESMPPT